MEAIDIVKTSYIKELLAKGEREDSRGMYDYRPIRIETGSMVNAEGSAQVDLGATKVLAGVKLVVEDTRPDEPNQGNLVCSAELLPMASPNYETGPPSPEAIEFARVVDRGIRHGECIDVESLLVEEGKAWTVYVDLYVMNYDGNLFDAGELAAMSALLNSVVPKYEDSKVIREERKTKLKIDNIVTSTTFAKIGNKLILDPTGNEEHAAACRFTIATDKENVRAMQKGLGGGLFVNEVEDLIDVSFNKHAELKDLMKQAQK